LNASTEITVPPANDLPNAPLGIRHLLLLTACTAVAFSVFDWLVDTSTQTPVMRAAGFAYCLIYGGALAGLCFGTPGICCWCVVVFSLQSSAITGSKSVATGSIGVA
jgi:hypothetical protein